MATAVAQQPTSTSTFAVPSALRDRPFTDLPPLRRVNADDARHSDAVHQREVRLQERRESSTIAADAAAQVPLVFSDAAYAPQIFDGSPVTVKRRRTMATSFQVLCRIQTIVRRSKNSTLSTDVD